MHKLSGVLWLFYAGLIVQAQDTPNVGYYRLLFHERRVPLSTDAGAAMSGNPERMDLSAAAMQIGGLA